MEHKISTIIIGKKNYKDYLTDVILNSLTKVPNMQIVIKSLKKNGLFNVKYKVIKITVIANAKYSVTLRNTNFFLKTYTLCKNMQKISSANIKQQSADKMYTKIIIGFSAFSS